MPSQTGRVPIIASIGSVSPKSPASRTGVPWPENPISIIKEPMTKNADIKARSRSRFYSS